MQPRNMLFGYYATLFNILFGYYATHCLIFYLGYYATLSYAKDCSYILHESPATSTVCVFAEFLSGIDVILFL